MAVCQLGLIQHAPCFPDPPREGGIVQVSLTDQSSMPSAFLTPREGVGGCVLCKSYSQVIQRAPLLPAHGAPLQVHDVGLQGHHPLH